MKYCGQCGTQHPDHLRFCTICGADMEQQRTPPPEAVAEAPPGAEAPPSLNAVPTKIMDGKVLELSGGTVIGGRYEVVRRLKQGGMGVVYLARDRQLPRDVALKLLLPTYKHDKQMLSRFRREAEAIARLNHANIVQIFDATEDETFGYFIAMEYVAGGSMDELLKAGGRRDLPRAKELATAILRALTYAHRQCVVHRDLKPSNVLLTRDGAPKVVDFGLAQLRGPSDMSVTGYGMGTPYYMAPEQRRDARNADHRADLYSFGATLYHMVTGSLPSAIRETRIPPELRKVTLACLEEEPENRPFSASEVLQMLQDAQEAPTPAPRRAEEDLLEEGKCPACGFMNDPGARFCESCGAGLYEKCPQCEHDLRIGRKFCSRCGLNVPQYKKFLDHVKAAAEQERVGRLSRAIKEATAAQELGFDDPAVGELLQRCGAKQAEGKALLQKADAAWRKEEYEAAQDAYQAVLQITPQDQEAVARIAETPGLIRARDIARHLAAAAEALQRREFETASREAAAVLEMDAENARAEQIKASAAEQIGRLRQIVARGREALERQQYREAADVLLTALPLASSRREVELRQLLTEANSRQIALEELLVEAREALGLGDYEAAGQHAGKARDIQAFNPDAAEMVQAAGEGQERIEGYLKIARSLLEARRYWAARDEFAKVLAEVRAAGTRLRNEAEAGHEAAAGRIRRYESAKARAEGLVKRQKFHEAVGIYRQLAASYPRRSEAAEALESARKGRTRRRTRRAVGSLIAGVVLAAAAIAGIGYANWRLVGGGEGHLAVGTERLGALLLRAIDANAGPVVGAPPADANAAPDPNAAFAPVTAEVAAARGRFAWPGSSCSLPDGTRAFASPTRRPCSATGASPNPTPSRTSTASPTPWQGWRPPSRLSPATGPPWPCARRSGERGAAWPPRGWSEATSNGPPRRYGGSSRPSAARPSARGSSRSCGPRPCRWRRGKRSPPPWA